MQTQGQIYQGAVMEEIDLKSAAQQMLEDWGKWAAASGLDLAFPHQEGFRSLLGSILPEPPINDQEGQKIDLMVSQLKSIDAIAHKMAVATWVYRLPIRTAADVLGITQRPAENARLFAVAWMAGAISRLDAPTD